MLSLPCAAPVTAGELNPLNAPYVIDMLNLATDKCLQGEFAALITAPVHKAVINQAGIAFTGHTEFLAERCQVDTVVMMLACDAMKVALVTTHLPLRQVADDNNPCINLYGHRAVTLFFTSRNLLFLIPKFMWQV